MRPAQLVMGFGVIVLVSLAVHVAGGGDSVPAPALTLFTLFIIMMTYVGGVYIYSLKGSSPQVLTPFLRQSMNYAVAPVKTAGSGVVVWPYGGFAGRNKNPFGLSDRKHTVFRSDVSPRPAAKGSKVFITSAHVAPLSDRAFRGGFPSVRDALHSHPRAKYTPKKAHLRLSHGLLSTSEATTGATEELDEILRRDEVISDLRDIIRAPEADLLKVLKRLDKKTGGGGLAALFRTPAPRDVDEEIEAERGKEKLE